MSRPPRIGIWSPAFRRGLNEAGFVEGRNVAIEYRWAEGQHDRLPALAADLVRRQVAVIAGQHARGAGGQGGDPTMPIVFVAADDPVKFGLVESFNRPGGNIDRRLSRSPRVSRPSGWGCCATWSRRPRPFGSAYRPELSDRRRPNCATCRRRRARLGRATRCRTLPTPSDFDAAFSTLVKQRADALLVGASPFFNNRRDQLVALAARHELPASTSCANSRRPAG